MTVVETPQFAVGVDIGGTNTVAAIVKTTTAEVIAHTSIRTEAQLGHADSFRRLDAAINRLCDEAGLSPADMVGIGVGATSPINSERGSIHNPFTLPTWDDAPVLPYFCERYGWPGVLLNDAAVAALGEYWAGAGCGATHMLYITVGTGIGGGILIHGQLHRGIGLMAGEVGHQVIDIHGPRCYCGANGCLETLAAAPAITQAAQNSAKHDSPLSKLVEGDLATITPKLVYEAALAGDTDARAILAKTGFYLGVGIANLINILGTDTIIMGGGVMQGWDLIAPTMLATVYGRGTQLPFDRCKIIPAALGLRAGVIGAVRGLLDALNEGSAFNQTAE